MPLFIFPSDWSGPLLDSFSLCRHHGLAKGESGIPVDFVGNAVPTAISIA
jgi:hypothetical protein